MVMIIIVDQLWKVEPMLFIILSRITTDVNWHVTIHELTIIYSHILYHLYFFLFVDNTR